MKIAMNKLKVKLEIYNLQFKLTKQDYIVQLHQLHSNLTIKGSILTRRLSGIIQYIMANINIVRLILV